MSFFSSRVLWQTLTPLADGYAFVSSEQNDYPYAPRAPRLYTVRLFRGNGIETVGEFQQYATRLEAIRAMRSAFAEVII
jgi:hypothetical protein